MVGTVTGNRTLIGWMDSREGKLGHRHRGFYLAKVDFTATGGDPETFVDEPDVIARSVALSKVGYRAATRAPSPEARAIRSTCSRPDGYADPRRVASRTRPRSSSPTRRMSRRHGGDGPRPGEPGAPAARQRGSARRVEAEVSRIRPAVAFIIGGPDKLAEQVLDDTAVAAGIDPGKVIRIDGGSDAGTAAATGALRLPDAGARGRRRAGLRRGRDRQPGDAGRRRAVGLAATPAPVPLREPERGSRVDADRAGRPRRRS